MSLTKKQVQIVDVLQSGGHIWRAGKTIFLARVKGHWANGTPMYTSEKINNRTFTALKDLLVEREGKWVLR